MSDFLAIWPFIIGAAVSPVVLVMTIYILSLPRDPIQKSVMLLLGAAVSITIISFVVFYSTTIQPNPSPNKDLLPHVIIGLLLLFLAYGIYHRGPARHKDDSKSKKHGPLGYIVLGVLLMITNFTTIAMLFEIAISIRAHSIVGTAKNTYLLASIFSSLAPVFIPILIVLVSGSHRKQILAKLSGVMKKYGHIVTSVFIAILGAYSLLKPFI